MLIEKMHVMPRKRDLRQVFPDRPRVKRVKKREVNDKKDNGR